MFRRTVAVALCHGVPTRYPVSYCDASVAPRHAAKKHPQALSSSFNAQLQVRILTTERLVGSSKHEQRVALTTCGFRLAEVQARAC